MELEVDEHKHDEHCWAWVLRDKTKGTVVARGNYDFVSSGQARDDYESIRRAHLTSETYATSSGARGFRVMASGITWVISTTRYKDEKVAGKVASVVMDHLRPAAPKTSDTKTTTT